MAEKEPNTETAIEAVRNEIRLQQVLAVFQHQVQNPKAKIVESCEAAGLPERTFYQWVEDGILENYLVSCRNSRAQVSSAIALEAVPDVIRYHIRIATGQEFARGTPPHVAAELIFAAAKGAALDSSAAEALTSGGKAPTFQFFPESMTFAVVSGNVQPVTEPAEVIEGEVIPSGEDDA